MNFSNNVFNLDRRIRYCAVLDEMGRTVSGGMRPGLPSLEPDDEAQKVDLQVAVIRGMTEAGRGYLGGTDYVIIHREKLMLVAIPINRRTVLISAQPDFPIERVKELIEVAKNSSPE
jgi:hypothetical protein